MHIRSIRGALSRGHAPRDTRRRSWGRLRPAIGALPPTLTRRRTGPLVLVGDLQLSVLRRGDYGYDAPWFPVFFGFLSMAAGIGATISWRQGMVRPAMQMT